MPTGTMVLKHSAPVIVVQSHCSCVAGSAQTQNSVGTSQEHISLYKAFSGYMPDMDLLHVSETYANFSPLTAPLVTTMEMSADVPLVESAFGPVQAGIVLSYQLPQPKTREIVKIADAPSPPILPLDGYRLQSSQCAYVLSDQEQFHD